MLREKITVMSLMELISSRPAEARVIPLQLVAERTKLPLDGVEFLLMKALSLHLIEGSVDQVGGGLLGAWGGAGGGGGGKGGCILWKCATLSLSMQCQLCLVGVGLLWSCHRRQKAFREESHCAASPE